MINTYITQEVLKSMCFTSYSASLFISCSLLFRIIFKQLHNIFFVLICRDLRCFSFFFFDSYLFYTVLIRNIKFLKEISPTICFSIRIIIITKTIIFLTV